MTIILCIFLFLYFHCIDSKEFAPILYVVIGKVNPQEYPRNPAFLTKLKGEKSSLQPCLFSRHSKRHSMYDQLQLSVALCGVALQLKI